MNKLITSLFILFLFGCAGIIGHTTGSFEYIAIPQPAIENPTFSVYVKGYYQDRNAWLKEQIESALMHQKISVLTYTNSRQFVTTTSGEGKSASAQDNSGIALAKDKVEVTTTSEFQSLVKSNYFIQADYDHWTFSIISMKNHEIVAKGTFTSLFVDDIKSNIKVVLREMKIIQ